MCKICASPIRNEVDLKINWKPDRVVKWAIRRGLDIDQGELDQHFNSHIMKPRLGKHVPEEISKSKRAACPDAIGNSVQQSIEKAATLAESHFSDDTFLNEVVSRTYQDLINGNLELKLEHGFKAIELKQKLAETSNVENLLLELMNEIRAQELRSLTNNHNPHSA